MCRIQAPPGLNTYIPTTAKQVSDATTATIADKARDLNTATYSQTKVIANPWWYGTFGAQTLRVSTGKKDCMEKK